MLTSSLHFEMCFQFQFHRQIKRGAFFYMNENVDCIRSQFFDDTIFIKKTQKNKIIEWNGNDFRVDNKCLKSIRHFEILWQFSTSVTFICLGPSRWAYFSHRFMSLTMTKIVSFYVCLWQRAGNWTRDQRFHLKIHSFHFDRQLILFASIEIVAVSI